MGQKIKKLKKIRLHREGTDQLVGGAIALVAIAAILWGAFDTKIPFWIFLVVFGVVYCIVLNFYRCPIRYLNVEDTEKLVVAPADGKIVVIEEVDNAPYFNDKRLMISIFMSLWNVHANWFPVDGKVKFVKHVDGNYHKAWLPKASEENEHADVMITTPEGVDVLCRQIAGAVAPYRNLCKGRRRVLYRRAPWLYQTRFTCGCLLASRNRSMCEDGTVYHG